MDPDELDVRRLSRAAGMAVAHLTGIAENCTRMPDGQRLTAPQAGVEIGRRLAPLSSRDRRLALAHAAAQYLDGEHQFQRDVVDLLTLAGADLALARRIAEARHAEGPSFLQAVVDQANQRDHQPPEGTADGEGDG